MVTASVWDNCKMPNSSWSTPVVPLPESWQEGLILREKVHAAPSHSLGSTWFHSVFTDFYFGFSTVALENLFSVSSADVYKLTC